MSWWIQSHVTSDTPCFLRTLGWDYPGPVESAGSPGWPGPNGAFSGWAASSAQGDGETLGVENGEKLGGRFPISPKYEAWHFGIGVIAAVMAGGANPVLQGNSLELAGLSPIAHAQIYDATQECASNEISLMTGVVPLRSSTAKALSYCREIQAVRPSALMAMASGSMSWQSWWSRPGVHRCGCPG